MKPTFFTLIFVLLAGCGADTQATSNANEELEMLFGKRPTETYVISSPMEGTLLQNGKPLAHTKIIRQLWWNGNEEGLVKEFMTDEQGRFSLPVHEEQLSLGKFTQFVCSTSLEAEVGGQRYDVWYNNKFDGYIYAETDGVPVSGLLCDINDESIGYDMELSRIMTVCKWMNMPVESEY